MNPAKSLDASAAKLQPQLIALAITLVALSMIGVLLDVPGAVILKSLSLLALAPVVRVAPRRVWRIYPPIETFLFCLIYGERLRMAEPVSMVALAISMVAVLLVVMPPLKSRTS